MSEEEREKRPTKHERLLASRARFAEALRDSFDETFGARERPWLSDEEVTWLWQTMPWSRDAAEGYLQSLKGAEACASFAPVIARVIRRFRNIERVRRFCENLRASEGGRT